MKNDWVFFIAARYFRSKRKDKNLAPSALSVLGIAVGVMTLISVLAVMNGFQLGFIEDILEISSYHLRIEPEKGVISQNKLSELRQLGEVRAVLPFVDFQTLIQGTYSSLDACFIRGVPPNTPELDGGFIEQLNLAAGSFDLTEADTIVIGKEMANALGVGIGNTVQLVSLAGGSFSVLTPENMEFTITGIFQSGYYDFDKTLCFISLESANRFTDVQNQMTFGVKIYNRFQDRSVQRQIKDILTFDEPANSVSIVSWREYNSSFFGALRTEKIIMMFLIGLIFVVVAVNIYHSLQRSVYERIEEISVLRATGASPLAVRSIFIIDGLFIGFLGGTIGLLSGLLISMNINEVFALTEAIINGGMTIIGKLLLPFMENSENFTLFSPRYYYLTEVPSQVLFREVLFIFLFSVFSSSAAAYSASKKITEIRPSEVLRYE